MTVIEIPDDQAAALQAKAAAQGLTLESWLSELATPDAAPDKTARAKTAAARIREISRRSKPDPDGLTAQDYIARDRP
jgi:hypothetical protein